MTAPRFSFLQQLAAHPKTTGAVTPSSNALSELIVTLANLPTARTVVELGSGTGVFTAKILARIGPTTRFLALENNSVFVQMCRARFPNADICAVDAKEINTVTKSRGYGACDVVVSGLPWAIFSGAEQENLLAEITNALASGGQFLTFAYLHGRLLPAGRRFHDLLKKYFTEVKKSKIVWRNLPPAFIYICRK
jgi:phospholipid N-methyltransferase